MNSLNAWPEWLLFRNWLDPLRADFQGKKAAVSVKQELTFPMDPASIGPVVEQYGASYIEFKPIGVAPGSNLHITVWVSENPGDNNENYKVAV